MSKPVVSCLKKCSESKVNEAKATRRIQFRSDIVYFDACMTKDKGTVAKLLREGLNINSTNYEGATALHMLSFTNHYAMIKFLIKQGININQQNNGGWTPLHIVARCNHLHLVKYYVKHKADLTICTNKSQLAGNLTTNLNIKKYLRAQMIQRGIDFNVARNRQRTNLLTEVLCWRQTNSALINFQNPEDGATALHIAAARGYVDIMEILFQSGVDIEKRDNEGWTPLHAAVYWNQKEAIELLFQNNANVDAKTNCNNTIFDMADKAMTRFLRQLPKGS